MQKKLLFEWGEYRFFDDNTYRCAHWCKEDFSYFEILEDSIYFKHDNGNYGYFFEHESEEWRVASVRSIKQEYEKSIFLLLEEAMLNEDN